MKIVKAYILSIDNELSREYTKTAIESCERIGLPYEIFEGFYRVSPSTAWNSIGLTRNFDGIRAQRDAAQLCTAGHIAIWKRISENNECAAILEHDAIMLHAPTVDIPDNQIVVLGYKTDRPERYDHMKAGPPTHLSSINGHEGAHAYAITSNTAKTLIHEIEEFGIRGAIDNTHFLRRQRSTKVPLSIMVPTPAIGWLRESTIWGMAANRNYELAPEVAKHWKP